MSPALPPKRVAVLYTSVEESLEGVEGKMRIEMDLAVSAREVMESLTSCGHTARCFTFDKDLAALASSLRELRWLPRFGSLNPRRCSTFRNAR
jgi:hypothetical protein